MNSRMRFSSSMAPSSLDKVMISPQAGQENVASVLVPLQLDSVGGGKKFPSKMCPDRHSHRLNYESPLTNHDSLELVCAWEKPCDLVTLDPRRRFDPCRFKRHVLFLRNKGKGALSTSDADSFDN
jgi:hypothetical protein